jgi:hypothetical protein
VRPYLTALLTLISFFAFGQYSAEEFEATLLPAKYGALLVYSGQKNSFSLKFESKSVATTDEPNFIRLDNGLMQSSIIPFTQKLDFNNLDNVTQKKFLTEWKAYEKGWVEGQLKVKLTDKEEFVEIANKPFLHWTYDMPISKEPGSVEKQIYWVTICFDQILILNGPVEKGKKEVLINDELFAIAKTLSLYPNQTQDIEKLYNELKK